MALLLSPVVGAVLRRTGKASTLALIPYYTQGSIKVQEAYEKIFKKFRPSPALAKKTSGGN